MKKFRLICLAIALTAAAGSVPGLAQAKFKAPANPSLAKSFPGIATFDGNRATFDGNGAFDGN